MISSRPRNAYNLPISNVTSLVYELPVGHGRHFLSHSNAVTDDFTGLAADYCAESLTPLWDSWLYSRAVP